MFKKVDKKTESMIACIPTVILVGMAAAAAIALLVLRILGKKKPCGVLSNWPAVLLIMGILKKVMAK